MGDYFSGFLDDIAAQDIIDFGGNFIGNDYGYLNGYESSDWANDPNSSPFNGMINDGNGNWYSDPSEIVNQPDFESGNLNWLQQLTGGGLNGILGSLGSAALIGTNLYQDYQSNELQQELLKQQALAQKGNLKLGDANTYLGYTKGAGDQTTSARDNLLLRQYMEQTQPYNRERELAILGKDGIDTTNMRSMTNSQSSGLSNYLNELLGYENQFKGYADDLTGMRDQDQLYNTLKPTQGALNTMSTEQPQSFDWMSTVPQGADPAQVAAYQQFLMGG